jgi:hypothetical protein
MRVESTSQLLPAVFDLENGIRPISSSDLVVDHQEVKISCVSKPSHSQNPAVFDLENGIRPIWSSDLVADNQEVKISCVSKPSHFQNAESALALRVSPVNQERYVLTEKHLKVLDLFLEVLNAPEGADLKNTIGQLKTANLEVDLPESVLPNPLLQPLPQQIQTMKPHDDFESAMRVFNTQVLFREMFK